MWGYDSVKDYVDDICQGELADQMGGDPAHPLLKSAESLEGWLPLARSSSNLHNQVDRRVVPSHAMLHIESAKSIEGWLPLVTESLEGWFPFASCYWTTAKSIEGWLPLITESPEGWFPFTQFLTG